MRHNFRRILSVVAVMVALVFGTSTLYSMVMADPPDTCKIDKFKEKKKAVPFPHKAHVDSGLKCKECHHKMSGDKPEKGCTACHKAKKGDAPAAKKAFHKSCKDCHKKMKKAGKKTGPTKCGDCHKG